MNNQDMDDDSRIEMPGQSVVGRSAPEAGLELDLLADLLIRHGIEVTPVTLKELKHAIKCACSHTALEVGALTARERIGTFELLAERLKALLNDTPSWTLEALWLEASNLGWIGAVGKNRQPPGLSSSRGSFPGLGFAGGDAETAEEAFRALCAVASHLAVQQGLS